MPPAETTTAIFATKGGRALIVHAWTEGRTYYTSLCKQLQITIGSPAFCKKDSLDVKGLVACDLCRAALKGEVNPHAQAHQLPPAAEKKALAKLDATESDAKPAAGACAYKASDVPGVCRCGILQEDHDASLVPGADQVLEDAGACTTCGLAVKRLPDGTLQHVQAGGVLTLKGRGGCKAAKLTKEAAPIVPPQPEEGKLFKRTKGYTARPAAFDPPEAPPTPDEDAAPPTPGPTQGRDAPAEPKGDEATCGPDCGPSATWVGAAGCSPRCEVLHRGRPHAAGDEKQLAAAFAATAPELPLHQQPGDCDHGTPLAKDCGRCDAPRGSCPELPPALGRMDLKQRCPRCLNSRGHKDLEWRPFDPSDRTQAAMLWAMCPSAGQPILLVVTVGQ